MFIVKNVDTNEVIEISPSQIISLRTVKDDKSIVRIRGSRGGLNKSMFTIEKDVESICNEIKKLEGNVDKLGKFHFWNDSTYTIPTFSLLREDCGTPHKEFCLVCGNFRQVYHTQRCGCRAERNFEGKIKNNSISAQMIKIDEDSEMDLKYDKFGYFVKTGSVKNISFSNDEESIAYGFVTINKEKVEVSSYCFDDNKLSEKVGVWYLKEDEK